MGSDALATSGLTSKILFLFRDRRLSNPSDPLYKVRKSRIVMFLALELAGFGATMAITQTIGLFIFLSNCSDCLLIGSDFNSQHNLRSILFLITAAIGFPVIIGLLIPLRVFIIPRLPFTPEELSILDGPTASPFVSFPCDVLIRWILH